jgi:hypothetical protein
MVRKPVYSGFMISCPARPHEVALFLGKAPAKYPVALALLRNRASYETKILEYACLEEAIGASRRQNVINLP